MLDHDDRSWPIPPERRIEAVLPYIVVALFALVLVAIVYVSLMPAIALADRIAQ